MASRSNSKTPKRSMPGIGSLPCRFTLNQARVDQGGTYSAGFVYEVYSICVIQISPPNWGRLTIILSRATVRSDDHMTCE